MNPGRPDRFPAPNRTRTAAIPSSRTFSPFAATAPRSAATILAPAAEEGSTNYVAGADRRVRVPLAAVRAIL